MAILRCIFILMVAVSCTLSLVAWNKYPNNDGGCTLPDGRAIDFQQVVHHTAMCGNYICWNEDGTTALNYCQASIPFQECNETGVNTNHVFPDCCWQCVQYVKC